MRRAWVEDKGLTVFSLWSPKHPGTEVDLFVQEPIDFGEAWQRRMDALLSVGGLEQGSLRGAAAT